MININVCVWIFMAIVITNYLHFMNRKYTILKLTCFWFSWTVNFMLHWKYYSKKYIQIKLCMNIDLFFVYMQRNHNNYFYCHGRLFWFIHEWVNISDIHLIWNINFFNVLYFKCYSLYKFKILKSKIFTLKLRFIKYALY